MSKNKTTLKRKFVMTLLMAIILVSGTIATNFNSVVPVAATMAYAENLTQVGTNVGTWTTHASVSITIPAIGLKSVMVHGVVSASHGHPYASWIRLVYEVGGVDYEIGATAATNDRNKIGGWAENGGHFSNHSLQALSTPGIGTFIYKVQYKVANTGGTINYSSITLSLGTI